MAVDQRDLPAPLETAKASSGRMLFHVAGTHEEGIDHMSKHGLLAGNGPTLTPRVDIGTWYNGGDFLTFWYPQRGEVNWGRERDVQTPTLPVTEEKRAEMLRELKGSEYEDWNKDAFRYVIERAKTYLPGERLRAVARSKTMGNPIEWLFPEESHRFIQFYNENKDSLPAKVKKALGKMEVKYLDQELNEDILAQDIIKTYVEHNLSNLGDYHGYPNDTGAGLERVIGTLQGGSFDDPVWERYRKMLISRFQKRLAQLPDSPDTEVSG
ncbi:MAG: hypothetical protein HY426_01630 [Candidatus Levybacteria bacterium]|nr:hypothetical protein [Candidatus Levybacteria bacterium]